MNTAAGVVVFAGIAVLIGAFILTPILFTPGRAKAVKRAEELSRTQIAHLTTDFRIRHPELIKCTRLDRHDSYVWVHAGLWCVGLGVILSPTPGGALTALSWDAQKLLGLCMLTGSTVAITGLCLGLRVRGRYVARPIVDHLLSDLLGDDIRIPYGLGALGLLSVGISMCGYGWTIYQYSTLIGTLGGGLTFAIGGMCATLAVRFVRRIYRYSRQRDVLLGEIAEQIRSES